MSSLAVTGLDTFAKPSLVDAVPSYFDSRTSAYPPGVEENTCNTILCINKEEASPPADVPIELLQKLSEQYAQEEFDQETAFHRPPTPVSPTEALAGNLVRVNGRKMFKVVPGFTKIGRHQLSNYIRKRNVQNFPKSQEEHRVSRRSLFRSASRSSQTSCDTADTGVKTGCRRRSRWTTLSRRSIEEQTPLESFSVDYPLGALHLYTSSSAGNSAIADENLGNPEKSVSSRNDVQQLQARSHEIEQVSSTETGDLNQQNNQGDNAPTKKCEGSEQCAEGTDVETANIQSQREPVEKRQALALSRRPFTKRGKKESDDGLINDWLADTQGHQKSHVKRGGATNNTAIRNRGASHSISSASGSFDHRPYRVSVRIAKRAHLPYTGITIWDKRSHSSHSCRGCPGRHWRWHPWKRGDDATDHDAESEVFTHQLSRKGEDSPKEFSWRSRSGELH